MPSHTYPVSDWRSSSLFGVSIHLWQLSDDADAREDFSLVVPETAFAKAFLRSVMALMKTDLGVDENILKEIAQNSLAHLLIKEEVIAESDDYLQLQLKEKDDRESNNNVDLCCEKRRKDCDKKERQIEVLLDDLAKKAKGSRRICPLNQCSSSRSSHDKADKEKKRRKSSADKKNFHCSSCKGSFSSDALFKDHVCLPPESCPICGRRFSAKKDLSTHQLIHSEQRPHECASCGVFFRHAQTLRRHRLTAHGSGSGNGSKAFACATCGKAFAVRQYLKRHELSHTGERPFVCHECGMAFSQSANLNKHAKLVHRNESNFVCETCGMTFVQLYYLKRHLRMKQHGEKS